LHVVERYVTGRYGTFGREVITHFLDLNDANVVRQMISRVKPDVLIHLASISPVSYSYDHPSEVLETNLLATVNLAEACSVVSGFSHMIYAGTSEEYGMATDRPVTEESGCIPNSPYSVSKYAGTKYLLYLNIAKQFPVTIMRATNTFGRTRDTHFFVERTLVQMLRGGRVTLGDPRPVRDFMFVDDHVSAYLRVLAERDKALGQIFNFSTGSHATIEEYAERMSQIVGYRGDLVWNSIPERPLDIPDHRIDSNKAKRTLGWEAKIPFDEGVRKTIEGLKSSGIA
jgi:dTDP-glucose 4,6-dehydratase